MIRITNSLFEAIQEVTQGKAQPAAKTETKEVAEGRVDKAHYCATHVEHAIFGEGECIAEAHADPDANGNIEWYTVQFSDGIRKVYTEAIKVKKAKMHEHAEVTDEEEQIDEVQTSAAARYVKAKMSHQASSTKKPMDSVGKEDADINNDGKIDKSDSYLHKRREAIKASMKEEVTVVLENLLTIEIPSNAKYSDYLDAVKTIFKTDDPEFQHDIVKIAAEAFDTGDIDVIVEAELIRQGIVEAYRSTAEYGNSKLYSKELGMDIDRTKPGVTRVIKRLAHTTGESPAEAKARRSVDKREKQIASMAKVLRAKK